MDARREALVLEQQPLVIRLARRMAWAPGLDFEDLVQAGMLGLVQAALKYEADNSTANFSTYAGYRILGSIRDSMRTTNSRRAKRVGETYSYHSSLDHLIAKNHLIEPAGGNVEEEADERLLCGEVYALLETCDRQGRDFTIRHFVNGESYAKIAHCENLSSSRVNQIVSRTLRKVRKEMQR